ncbi:hypothetical protein XENORESO_009420 [Xenotaenia resolanae]|uniref:Uncharacterized protein n=1 Tax=Xenotaenia resolanae TaxID=208358 RepID=A0ABV0X1S7_9TELE
MVCWSISAARGSAPYEKAALFSQKTVNKQDEVIGTTACLCLSDGDDDGAPHWITVDSASTSSFILPLQPFHHFRTGAVNQCIVATFFSKEAKTCFGFEFLIICYHGFLFYSDLRIESIWKQLSL